MNPLIWHGKEEIFPGITCLKLISYGKIVIMVLAWENIELLFSQSFSSGVEIQNLPIYFKPKFLKKVFPEIEFAPLTPEQISYKEEILKNLGVK